MVLYKESNEKLENEIAFFSKLDLLVAQIIADMTYIIDHLSIN